MNLSQAMAKWAEQTAANRKLVIGYLLDEAAQSRIWARDADEKNAEFGTSSNQHMRDAVAFEAAAQLLRYVAYDGGPYR